MHSCQLPLDLHAKLCMVPAGSTDRLSLCLPSKVGNATTKSTHELLLVQQALVCWSQRPETMCP